jgi:DNA-binding MarR family transcriptional regulator
LRIEKRGTTCNHPSNAILTVGISAAAIAAASRVIQLDDYVIDVLMRDLVGHDRRIASFLVYLWFASEQRKGKSVAASYRQIAEAVGISKSSAQAAVAWLIKRKLLESTRKTVTATPRYRVLTPWRR